MTRNIDVIPRKIWFLWYQGLPQAPMVVKKCYQSWKRNNPTWEIIFLDQSNLNNYITPTLPAEKLDKLRKSHQSDLLRLQLLSEHGGVWVDATTFCMRPLDDWLGDYLHSGFFAFHKPGRDRNMSSWFIAAEKSNPLVVKLRDSLRSFWIENSFGNRGTIKRKIVKVFIKIFNRNPKTTRLWFSWVVTKVFRVYPYFVFHYMFDRLVATDSQCFSIWKKTKKYSANVPHKIQHSGFHSPLDETLKREIDNKLSPLYKLSWKYDHNKYCQSSVLHYLLEEASENTPGTAPSKLHTNTQHPDELIAELPICQ